MRETPPSVFEARVDDHGGTRTITLEGELDGGEVASLSDALDGVDPGMRVVVDGSGLTFVDSMGLRLLVEWHLAVTSRGGSLVVQSPSPSLRRLIDATNLNDLLALSEERDASSGAAEGAPGRS